MSSYKLYYFNVTGLGEPIRYLLHYVGADFEDFRFKDFDEWTSKYKKEMPMEQVPVLEIDGVKYHQHIGICRYIARKFDLDASDAEEAAQIDALIYDIEDMRLSIAIYFKEEDPTFKAMLKERMEKKYPFYLDKLDARVKKNEGFFSNGKITWADIYYAGISEILTNVLGQDINENHSNLKKLVEKVRSFDKIKGYLEKRPKTDL